MTADYSTLKHKNMAKTQYNKGKLPKLWEFLVKLHETSPQAFSSPDYLKAHVGQVWKALSDHEHCPNCGESMTEYVHKLDFFNALLLKEMGDVVKKNVAKGMSFRDANQVHVVSQDFHDCVRHRTTQCRTLGLIAKVKTEKGTHDRDKGWLITARGFAALRGERVPAEVTVFRNTIEERTDIKTTLDEVFNTYKGENRSLVGERDPYEWVNFGKLHEGAMF